MTPPKHFFKEVCIFCAEKEGVGKHRARVAARLTPPKADPKEGQGRWPGTGDGRVGS